MIERYGRWTVLQVIGARRFCRCKCGTERWVASGNLRAGISRSCGCLQREVAARQRTTHGATKKRAQEPLFQVWRNMLRRCETPAATYYRHYGGRGIRVCPEWHSYPEFRAWAVASGYGEGLTIDRLNNDGHYEPSNCRWVNRYIQANNTRRNRRMKAFGEERTIAEWSRDPRCRVSYKVLEDRLQKLGWPPEVAITTPRGAVKTGPKRHSTVLRA